MALSQRNNELFLMEEAVLPAREGGQVCDYVWHYSEVFLEDFALLTQV
jgi:hypothetical protein